MRKKLPFVAVVILALVASASTWFYMNHILIPQQVADAAAYNKPRGSFSDLYPRWLGARELLLHGRNPYGSDITREIQQGYYGRPLNPSKPHDPKDQQGFAYPVYVVFLLAPTIRLPFDVVQAGFRWLFVVITVADVFLWLYVLRWRVSARWRLVLVILMLGWFPVVQALKLQQLTLLVTGILAGCCASVVAGWLGTAGVLLAFATVKPQLTWPLALWLLFWALSQWRSRRRLVYSFALVMLVLLAGAQLALPGWLRMFVQAIREYRQYTQGVAVPVMLFGPPAGHFVQAISFVISAVCFWRLRREPSASAVFGRTVGLVLALTVILMPMSALYNQVLLAPAVLALVDSAISKPIAKNLRGLAWMAGAGVTAWSWIATLSLLLLFRWITPEVRSNVVAVPFYSSLPLPLVIFGLAAFDVWTNPSAGLRDGAGPE